MRKAYWLFLFFGLLLLLSACAERNIANSNTDTSVADLPHTEMTIMIERTNWDEKTTYALEKARIEKTSDFTSKITSQEVMQELSVRLSEQEIVYSENELAHMIIATQIKDSALIKIQVFCSDRIAHPYILDTLFDILRDNEATLIPGYAIVEIEHGGCTRG